MIILERKFQKVILLENPEDTLIVKINDIAVSFFHYPYPLIPPALKLGSLPPLASKEDIAAMKIIAISDRGTKRDLLKGSSLRQALDFVRKKYPECNIQFPGIRLKGS